VILRLRIVLLALGAVALMSCTKHMNYSPAMGMSIHESQNIIEELMMTQHRAWKPDAVAFTDSYMVWGSGFVSHTGDWERRTTTTRDSRERIYYKHVREVQLLDWIRKFRQWYVVDAILQGSKGRKRLLVTREVDDAKRFVDALVSLLAARGANNAEPPRAVDAGSPSNSDQ
jgi:hypothetical protein